MKLFGNIISIVGITGSGKTDFALQAAAQLIAEQKFEHVALISADSRQVYQGLEIISGADIPAQFEYQQVKQRFLLYPYFLSPEKTISLHGVSIVPPSTAWSLGHFKELVQSVQQAYQDSRTAFLVVGGTGLYHRWLYQPDNWYSVPPNPELRAAVQSASVADLQQQLQAESQAWFAALNHSDAHNPRRLIRAIERAQAGLTPEAWQQQSHEVQWIGLQDQAEERESRIQRRVEARLAAGAVAEVQALQQRNVDPALPAWSTLGVPQILQHLAGELSQEELIENWMRAELGYCKRQLTWFAREPISWIAAEDNRFDQAYQAMTELLADS